MPCTRRYFDQAYYDGLSDEDKETFYKCIKTGFDNADSGMGCYAMTPTDYTTFAPFFAKAIGDYHKGDPACAEQHENDWDISGVGEGGVPIRNLFLPNVPRLGMQRRRLLPLEKESEVGMERAEDVLD